MLCYFGLYNEVDQLHVYVYRLFLGFPSRLGHHRTRNRVPCAVQ